MGRFFIFLGLCVVLALTFYSWRQKKRRIFKEMAKKHKKKNHETKPRERLIQDPETGEYRVKSDNPDNET